MALNKFMRLVKVDEAKRQAWGLATAEVPDKSGEICDYDGAKAAYQAWSKEAKDATTKAGTEVSLGNVRLQHSMQPVGKVIEIEYRDPKKEVYVGTYIDDDNAWRQIQKGVLTGFSHGGEYAWRKCNECGQNMLGSGNYCTQCEKTVETRYAPVLAELSVVDNPCLGVAHFDYVKADGSTEVRDFVQKNVPADPAGASASPTLFDMETVAEKAAEKALAKKNQQETAQRDAEAASAEERKKAEKQAEVFGELCKTALAKAREKRGMEPLKKDYCQMDSLWRQLYTTLYLSDSANEEGDRESGDERDYDRSDQLKQIAEQIAEIISDYTQEELSELLQPKQAAAKAAGKGSNNMSLTLLKAAQKTLSAHYTAKAAYHDKCAKIAAKKADLHKKAAESEDTPEGLKEVHKALADAQEDEQKQHEKCAGHYEKLAEARKKESEKEDEEDADKAVAAESALTKSILDAIADDSEPEPKPVPVVAKANATPKVKTLADAKAEIEAMQAEELVEFAKSHRGELAKMSLGLPAELGDSPIAAVLKQLVGSMPGPVVGANGATVKTFIPRGGDPEPATPAPTNTEYGGL